MAVWEGIEEERERGKEMWRQGCEVEKRARQGCEGSKPEDGKEGDCESLIARSGDLGHGKIVNESGRAERGVMWVWWGGYVKVCQGGRLREGKRRDRKDEGACQNRLPLEVINDCLAQPAASARQGLCFRKHKPCARMWLPISCAFPSPS